MKKNIMRKTGKIFCLSLFLIFILFPFVWILLTSFKPQKEIFSFPLHFLPQKFTLDNYIKIFEISRFGIYFLNSFIVALVGAACSMFIGLLGGYILARFKFKGKSGILVAYLFTQMIPMFILLAPLYVMLSKYNMTNKLSTLMILYTAMLIPYCTVTLKGFFQRIPYSLEEAAMIDGCGRFRALFKIIIPLMLPGISATYMFAFVQCWNEIFAAIMFIDVEKYKTIPVALNSFIMKYDIDWGSLSAGTVISIFPTIILFAFAQKFIAEGLTQGAVKG